jgi:Protein of unknown function (DUF3551)
MQHASVRHDLLGYILMGLTILLAALVTIDAAAAASRPPRPYCMSAERGPMQDCAYVSMQQCLASASGVGGRCYENPKLEWQRLEAARRGARPGRRTGRQPAYW